MISIKNTSLAAAIALLGLAANANAADSADLTVTGTVKSPACGITLSGGGNANFGPLARSLLKSDRSVGVGAKPITATVQCDEDTLLSLKVVDTKPTEKPAEAMNFTFEGTTIPGASTSHGNDFILGLGLSPDDTPIGGYLLAFGKPKVDGTDAFYITANSTNTTAYTNYDANVLYFRKDSQTYFGANSNGTAIMNMPGKVHEYPMAVAVSLDMSGRIPGDQDIILNGRATLEVVYL